MAGVYEHIRIEKEPLINDRRTAKQRSIKGIVRPDPAAHGRFLGTALRGAAQVAKAQPGAEDGNLVLKLSYSGSLDLGKLNKHGVEFISQEDKTVCIVFTSEQGLAEFADHLARLGLPEGQDLSYQNLLLALDGIGNWCREDRESWAIKHFGIPDSATFKLDVELWPLGGVHSPERTSTVHRFEEWIKTHGIYQIDRINRDSLLLYRLDVTKEQAAHLLEHRDVRLVDLPPRTGITYQQMDVPVTPRIDGISSPPSGAAKVCILDSGINSNHPLLRAAFGEAESYIAGQDAEDEVGHGTAVAGIVLYGNIEECLAADQWKPELVLCSGKIMTKAADTNEAVFDEKTIEQTIEKAVAYFAGELGCRIFNLSLGNENVPYDGRHIRGIAYTLDRLAREYDILFVVSAGNFRGTETIPQSDWRAEYPEYLLAPDSFIIDPAPALNVLTIGALANHTANLDEQRYGNRDVNALSPAAEDQPAPFTRHGPSIKGAIKPDLVAHGGNLASPMRQEGQQIRKDNRRLGVLVPNHNFIGATLLKDISGTSFSAPYVTHLAGRLLNSFPRASANLLRALLVNHADVPLACISAFPDQMKEHVRQVVGYGKVNTDTLFRSTDDKVVLLTESAIENDSHQFYELPLPDEFLRSNRATRQIRVTLAYCPPVKTTRMEYLATKISYRLVKGNSLDEVQRHFNQALKKEEDSIGDAAASNRTITSQERERCTVQSSIWTLKQLSPKQKWFVVVTRQDKEWGRAICLDEENYALVVSVSDRENLEARLYAQIQARVRVQVQTRVRLGA
ncbi:S8 family peptidase [Nitrosomonas sp. sh817]|uniref:S8 family peptidase n=1 Tax=Nitrosomonas sp. sh817 TaxID=3070658 RepID=UPI0027DABB7E|nr:S8 family peptidase [Nitrosomonas sp. sh817]WMJ07516.1 S8 family peptidase [Nitrosomonas sp. sh817]